MQRRRNRELTDNNEFLWRFSLDSFRWRSLTHPVISKEVPNDSIHHVERYLTVLAPYLTSSTVSNLLVLSFIPWCVQHQLGNQDYRLSHEFLVRQRFWKLWLAKSSSWLGLFLPEYGIHEKLKSNMIQIPFSNSFWGFLDAKIPKIRGIPTLNVVCHCVVCTKVVKVYDTFNTFLVLVLRGPNIIYWLHLYVYLP